MSKKFCTPYKFYVGKAGLYVSEHFQLSEFACKDGSPIIYVDANLISVLEDIRNYYNSPVHINSGFRSYYWNNQIGGSTNSYHMRGQAADITVDGVRPSEIQELVKTWFSAEDFGGVGCYDNFTHVDVRNTYTTWKG